MMLLFISKVAHIYTTLLFWFIQAIDQIKLIESDVSIKKKKNVNMTKLLCRNYLYNNIK